MTTNAGQDLRELVAKWRGPFLGRSNRADEGARLAYRHCANELEAALAGAQGDAARCTVCNDSLATLCGYCKSFSTAAPPTPVTDDLPQLLARMEQVLSDVRAFRASLSPAAQRVDEESVARLAKFLHATIGFAGMRKDDVVTCARRYLTAALSPAPQRVDGSDYKAGLRFIVANRTNILRFCAGPTESFVVGRTLDILAANGAQSEGESK